MEKQQKTIVRILDVTKRHSKICSGWIAGKDSTVLNDILVKSGIDYTPIMWRGINEWPIMAKYIAENSPKNIIFEIIDKFDFDFLNKHPNYLFCQGDTRTKWMAEKWKRQRKDVIKHGFDLFITGRRLSDGNQCGTKENNFQVKKHGYTTFSPIADWTHEELLAYIKYNNIDLPPFYDFPRGFLIGSIAMGEWTEYACLDKTIFETWQEVYAIDSSVVINAAQYLDSAKQFLLSNN